VCSSQALPPFQNFPNVKFFHSPNQPSLTYSVKTEVNHISLVNSLLLLAWSGGLGPTGQGQGQFSFILL